MNWSESAVSAAADLQGERKWAEALDLLDRTASREGRDTRIDELRATVAAELRTHEAQVARAATDARQRIQDFQWEEAVLHLSTAVRELPGEQILDDLMQEAQRGLAQKRRDAATPVYARPPATSPETASELQPRIAAARARAVEARRKVRIAELEHKIGESIGAGLLEKAETELQGAEREFPGEASFATWREVLAEERRRIAREAVIRDANDQAQRLLEQARTLINDERYLGALALLEPAATRFPEIGAFSSMLAEVREGAAVEREVRRLDAAEQEIRSLMAEQKYEEALKEADEGLNEYPGEQVFQDLRALIAVSIEEQAAVVAVAEKVHRLVAAGKGTEADRALLEALRRYPGRMKLEKMRSEVDAARKAEWDRQSREAGLRREVSEIEKLLGEGRLAEASTAAAELENKYGKEAALEVAQRIGAAVAQAERQRLAAERNLAKPEFELHTNIVSVSDKTSEERYAESTQRMPVHSSAPLGEESISALAPSSEPRALPPTKLQRPPSLGSTPASPVRPPLDPWQPHWVFKAIELAEKAPGGTAATPGPSAKDREIEPPLFGEVPPAAATFEDRESTPASTHGGRKLVTWALVVCALIAIGLVGALWLNSVQDDTAVSKPMKVVPPTTPTDLEVQRFRGLIANGQSEFTKGNYDAALAWFEEAQRIEPGNREARDAVADLVSAKKAKEDLGTKDALNRAERAFKNGSYDEAIQVCLQVLSHDPNNNRAKQRLARARAASEAEKRAFGRK
jgi:tetratricopeptide (TPR) repeat protein